MSVGTVGGGIGEVAAESLKPWGNGLVTLLGDAAHPCTPNLGQGDCLALEDALVLAKSFGERRHPNWHCNVTRVCATNE